MSGAVRSGEAGQLSKLPIVSIILVSYNTRKMTLECLRSVMHETRTDFELIVLDNDSSDGSAEAVWRESPQVTLIESRQNLGLAGGNNAAARGATGDYILLLKPDSVILDGAIDKLV